MNLEIGFPTEDFLLGLFELHCKRNRFKVSPIKAVKVNESENEIVMKITVQNEDATQNLMVQFVLDTTEWVVNKITQEVEEAPKASEVLEVPKAPEAPEVSEVPVQLDTSLFLMAFIVISLIAIFIRFSRK